MFTTQRNCHTAQTINPAAGFNAMPLWSQISKQVFTASEVSLDRSYEGKATETMLRGADSE